MEHAALESKVSSTITCCMLLVCVVIIPAIHNSQDRGRRSRVCFKAEYCSEAERKHNHYKYLANITLVRWMLQSNIFSTLQQSSTLILNIF